MAKAGSITITQGTQEIANNRTYITVTGKITTTGESYRGNSRTGTYTITQNGTVIQSGSFTHGAPANSTTTLFSVSLWVAHDSSGNSGTISVSYNYDNGWCTGSGSTTLTKIPRYATINSAPNFTDGENPTIKYSNPAGNAVSSLQACISLTGSAADVPYRNIPINGTSYQFILTEEERNTLRKATPNATSRTVIFYVRTVLAGVTNHSTLTRTFTISDNVIPTAAVNLSDTEGHLEKYGKYVQGQSKLQVSIHAEGVYGSTIKSYRTTFDGRTFTEAEFTTDAITGKDKLELEVIVTDSRGRSCTVKESIEVYEYSRPKITLIKTKRCQQHNVNLIGDKYLGVLFSAAVTSLDNQNTATYELDYKRTTDEKYTTLSLEDCANQYAAEGNRIFAADDDAYNIILRITDDFGPVEKKVNGPSVSVLVSKLRYNLGLAFGKLAELAGVLDIGFKTRFFGGILQMVLEDGSDFDELTTSNIFTLKESSVAGYLNCPIEEGTGTLTVEECGENKIHQIVKSCDKTNPKVYERFYDEEWGEWIWINAPYGFIMGYIPTAVTVNGYGTIPFVEKNKSGPYFTLQDGVITIGKNVACVRVSAVIGGSAVSGRCWAHLEHIDASRTNVAFADAIQYGAFVSPHLTEIMPVNEGDTLRVYAIDEFTARSGGVDCYISVERMK